MKIDTYTIASIAIVLKKYLDMKRVSHFKKTELIDYLTTSKIESVRNEFEFHPRMKQYTAEIFNKMSNLYQSHVINLDTIMAVIIDYYIRTGKPLNYCTKIPYDVFKERLKYLSVLGANGQLEILKTLHDEYKEQSPFNKFSGKKLTIFGLNDKQENKLYELVKSGEVSYLIYALFWSNSKFDIDESKIDDFNFLKFVRLMKYVKQKEIKIEKIKYEV